MSLNGATTIISRCLDGKITGVTQMEPYDFVDRQENDSSHYSLNPLSNSARGKGGKSAKRCRDKERRQRKRRDPVKVTQHRQKLAEGHLRNAAVMEMANDLESCKHSGSGYLGSPRSRLKPPTLRQLVGLGFTVKRYDG
jgi:hypothetical protein